MYTASNGTAKFIHENFADMYLRNLSPVTEIFGETVKVLVLAWNSGPGDALA